VGTLRVVEPNPVFDHAFSLEPVLQFVQIDGFLFERPPQPFDEDIVHCAAMHQRCMRGEIPAPSVHRDFDVSLAQGRDPG